jgi:hypothetical protein
MGQVIIKDEYISYKPDFTKQILMQRMGTKHDYAISTQCTW